MVGKRGAADADTLDDGIDEALLGVVREIADGIVKIADTKIQPHGRGIDRDEHGLLVQGKVRSRAVIDHVVGHGVLQGGEPGLRKGIPRDGRDLVAAVEVGGSRTVDHVLGNSLQDFQIQVLPHGLHPLDGLINDGEVIDSLRCFQILPEDPQCEPRDEIIGPDICQTLIDLRVGIIQSISEGEDSRRFGQQLP